MQYFTKDSDETVLNDIRTLMNDPEKCSAKEKQDMSRALEKYFRNVMSFDNKKLEYGSYEELWSDPKHKDLHIMAGIAMESESLLHQYADLMKDPEAKCALDENMFKEVSSKVYLLENEATVSVSSGAALKLYKNPGMADFDPQKLMRIPDETLSDMHPILCDQGFALAASLVHGAEKTIKPKEQYLDAINKERKKLGMTMITDEKEIDDRYKDIIDAINKAASPEMQKAQEKEAPAGQKAPEADDKTELNVIDEKEMKAEPEIDIEQEENKIGVPENEEIKAEVPAKEEAAAENIVDDIDYEIDLNVIDENEMEAELDEIINKELEYGPKEQTAKMLNELTTARDAKGLVKLLNDIRKEFMRKGKLEEEDNVSFEQQAAVNDYLSDISMKVAKGELTKEERKFYLDVYDENSIVRSNACVDLGKRIDQAQEEIRTGGFKDTELLVDNPKVVKLMAQQYVTVNENGKEITDYRAANAVIQDLNISLLQMQFDDEEMSFNVDGTGYVPNDLYDYNSALGLLERHNWKKMYETFKNCEDVSLDKLKKYNDYGNMTGDVATTKYKLHIGQKDGHIEITELPGDIQRIKSSDTGELQKYRDEVLGEIASLNIAKESVKPIHD